jgi:hypothetical protein
MFVNANDSLFRNSNGYEEMWAAASLDRPFPDVGSYFGRTGNLA